MRCVLHLQTLALRVSAFGFFFFFISVVQARLPVSFVICICNLFAVSYNISSRFCDTCSDDVAIQLAPTLAKVCAGSGCLRRFCCRLKLFLSSSLLLIEIVFEFFAFFMASDECEC